MEGTKKVFVRTDDVAFFGPKKKKEGLFEPAEKGEQHPRFPPGPPRQY